MFLFKITYSVFVGFFVNIQRLHMIELLTEFHVILMYTKVTLN